MIEIRRFDSSAGRSQPFDQKPFAAFIPQGKYLDFSIQDKNGKPIEFDPPIYDHIAERIYPLESDSGHKPVHFDGTVICFIKAYSDRYFHWIYDILPCFRLLEELDLEDYRVYVSQCMKFQRQTLRLLGQKVIPADEYPRISADRLIFLYSGSRFDPEIGRYLYSLLPSESEVHDRKIYISRKDARHRRVLNEREVFDVLREYGFKFFTFSQLDLTYQWKLFNESRIVVTPHGAAACNSFFCKPETSMIHFWPQVSPRLVEMYPKHVRHVHMVCGGKINDNMVVDIGELKNSLVSLL